VLTVVVVLVAPVCVVAALAVRFAYDDWQERKALRREVERAQALRRAAKPWLRVVEGPPEEPAGGEDERPGKTA
jgi:hypothetical protein